MTVATGIGTLVSSTSSADEASGFQWLIPA